MFVYRISSFVIKYTKNVIVVVVRLDFKLLETSTYNSLLHCLGMQLENVLNPQTYLNIRLFHSFVQPSNVMTHLLDGLYISLYNYVEYVGDETYLR